MTFDEEIRNFKIKLLRKLPFYGDVVLKLGFIERKDIPTASTDGRNIYYNTKFFKKLNEGQRNYVLMHEIFHVILMHGFRGKGRNSKLWNVACDMVVNAMCDNILYDFRNRANMPFERPEKGIFDSVKAYDTVENIYNKLLAAYDKHKDARTLMIIFKNKRWGLEENVEIDINKSDDLIVRVDNENEDEEVYDSIYIQEVIKEAVYKDRGNRGSYFVPEQIYELTASKTIKWQKLLKDFLQTDIGEEISYTTPERKYIHMDLILPGRGPTDERLEEIWTFIDSSGSISHNEMEEFLTQVYRIAKEFGCRTNICYWDTEVTDTYLNIRNERDIVKCIPRHSGGTNINCVYRWIRDNKVKPDVMIILTDGYFGRLKQDIFLPKYGKKTVLVLSTDIDINDDMKRIGKITRLEK